MGAGGRGGGPMFTNASDISSIYCMSYACPWKMHDCGARMAVAHGGLWQKDDVWHMKYSSDKVLDA